jgi:hypothetical protein
MMSEIREGKSVQLVNAATTSEERTLAALAHASTFLTLLVGVPTLGLGGILFAFIPFVIYLSYKDRSRFVANQAAQAFALQVIGTVGWFVLLLAGGLVTAVLWLVTGVLSMILIGLILIPVAILVTLAIITIWIGAPFVFVAFALVSTIETANGHDYRYPYVGQWVSDWLTRQESEAVPAV